MLTFLMGFKWIKWLFDNRKGVGIAVLVVLIGLSVLYVSHIRSENVRLEGENAVLTDTLKAERENHAKTIKALEDKAKDAEDRHQFRDKTRKEIEKDRKEGDGVVAPVLRNAVERLRDRQTTRAEAPR